MAKPAYKCGVDEESTPHLYFGHSSDAGQYKLAAIQQSISAGNPAFSTGTQTAEAWTVKETKIRLRRD